MKFLNFLKDLGQSLSILLMKAGFVLTLLGILAPFFNPWWGVFYIATGAATLAASWRLF